MEFTIDFASVRKIISEEYRRTRAEIAEEGAVRAYRHSQQRLDERLAAAPDASTLACKAGCSWCCYFTVDVRPVEVFSILDYIHSELTSAERERVLHEVEMNNAVLEGLNIDERSRRNLKCAFLAAGRCTIYAARPQTCRNYHATSAAGCQQSFEEPDNLDIDPEFAPLVYQTGAAHVDAFSKAMCDAGYDIAAFELHTALAAAMAQPTIIRQRFEARQRPFADLQGAEVPLEFMEEDESPE